MNLELGDRWRTPGLTITETHLVLYTALAGDFFPLHVDAQVGRASRWGERVVQGPLLYAVATGLVQRTGRLDGLVEAFLGVRDLRHLQPCFVGDTIHVDVQVENPEAPEKHAAETIVLRYGVINQEERHLLDAQMQFLRVTTSDERGQ